MRYFIADIHLNTGPDAVLGIIAAQNHLFIFIDHVIL